MNFSTLGNYSFHSEPHPTISGSKDVFKNKCMHLSCRITSNSLSFKNHELEWFHRCSFRRINELICFIQTIIIVLYILQQQLMRELEQHPAVCSFANNQFLSSFQKKFSIKVSAQISFQSTILIIQFLVFILYVLLLLYCCQIEMKSIAMIKKSFQKSHQFSVYVNQIYISS